ncbi:MAG: disulfide bond formation protein B [Dongiaceae bacterium]
MLAPPDFPRRLALLVMLAGILALGTAFLAQFVGGLAPCELCLWQRYPYGVAIGLAALAMVFAPSAGAARVFLALAALAILASAGIAAFHVGVEQKWWQGLASCSGTINLKGSATDLARQLTAAPVVRCDAVPWSLFGISMAGYNFLFATAVGLLTFWAATRTARS